MSAPISPFVSAALAAPLPPSSLSWLNDARRDNLNHFARIGLPDTRVEAWKYTSLRALARRHFIQGDGQADQRVIDAPLLTFAGLEGPQLTFVNGLFRADLSHLSNLPAGLTLQPLSQALVAGNSQALHFALSRRYDTRVEAFASLNAAYATDGVVLRAAAGVKVAMPIQLVFVSAKAEDELLWHARNVIVLGDHAELTLIERHVGQGGARQLGTLGSELLLNDCSKLQHVLVQDAAPETSLIQHHNMCLGRQAQHHLHVLQLGGALVHHMLQAKLEGERAHLDTRGVFVPQRRQHIDTQLTIHHQAARSVSSARWHGVADGRGRGVFRGAIKVAPGADGSDASLYNKNLLLSPDAEIDTRPELEIYADEVQAAHGATVGDLDENTLFYLRSRGIHRDQARGLLTTAFCHVVLDDLPDKGLREQLCALLSARLAP